MRASDGQVEQFERVASRALGAGVAASAVLLLAGVLAWITGLEPWATLLLDAGLVVLMATPAARVVVSLVEYLRARDWFFVLTTGGVILVLLATLMTAMWAR
jgi:uncharacterized membrane protein